MRFLLLLLALGLAAISELSWAYHLPEEIPYYQISYHFQTISESQLNDVAAEKVHMDGKFVSNYLQVCRNSRDFLRGTGTQAYIKNDGKIRIEEADVRTRFVPPPSWVLPPLVDRLNEFYTWLGMLRTGPENVCSFKTTEWLAERSSPCVDVGNNYVSTIRARLPENLMSYYNVRVAGNEVTISAKGKEQTRSLVHISCKSWGGMYHEASGPTVKLWTNTTAECLVAGGYYVKSCTRSRQMCLPVKVKAWMGTRLDTFHCEHMMRPIKLPFFLLGVGRAAAQPFLLQYCTQNQNNGAFGGVGAMECK